MDCHQIQLLIVFSLIAVYVAATTARPKNDTFLPSDNERIINGELEDPNGEIYQYIAKLMIVLKKGALLCGGTFISDKLVLTAAHCTPPTMIVHKSYVQVGYDMKTKWFVEKLFKHPNFKESIDVFKNDLSVLLIKFPYPIKSKPLNLGRPIKLHKLTSRVMAKIYGWGMTEHNVRTVDLKKADVIASPPDQCPDVSQFMPPNKANGMICAVNTNPLRTVWSGDSGGPLVRQDFTLMRGEPLLMGVISLGRSAYVPGYFVDIFDESNTDFIANVILATNSSFPRIINSIAF